MLLLVSCKEEKPDLQTSSKAQSNYQKSLSFLQEPDSMIYYADEGLRYIEQKDSLYPKLLDCKIYANNAKHNYQTSILLADQHYDYAQQHKDTSKMALALYRKAVSYRHLDNQAEVFKNSFRSRQLYLLIGDSSKAGGRSLEMANAQSRRADHHGAQLSATEALKLLDPQKDSIYFSSAHNVIAMAYEAQGFPDDAIKEYKAGLKYVTTYDEKATIIQNMALVDKNNENLEEARQKFSTIDTGSIKSENLKYRILQNITYLEWRIDHDYPAENVLKKVLEFRENDRDLYSASNSYYYLSKVLADKQPDSALFYARKWHSLTTDFFELDDQVASIKNRMELEPPTKKLELLDEFILLSDSLRSRDLKAKNSFAKIRYDEETKQKQILQLENQNFQQKEATTRFRNGFIYVILLSLLLVISGFFLWYYLKQRHRSEKILQIHQTESRISKVIHDEIANDLYNIMSSLGNNKNISTINKLEEVYDRTRDISRQNNQINTGEQFPENLKAILSASAGNSMRLFLNGFDEMSWEKISDEKKIVIYRVLQELTINSRKHSQAKFIAIHFERKPNTYLIHYSDNGVGFKAESLLQKNGLQNTENRIFSIKGSIKFESNKGFKASISIPA